MLKSSTAFQLPSLRLASSLGGKIVAVLVALSLLSCAAVGYAAYLQARSALIEEQHQKLALLTEQKRADGVKMLDGAAGAVKSVTSSRMLIEKYISIQDNLNENERKTLRAYYGAISDVAARAADAGVKTKTMFSFYATNLHPPVQETWANADLGDILLVSEKGEIEYTVTKGADFLSDLDKADPSGALRQLVERAKKLDPAAKDVVVSAPFAYAGAEGDLSIFVAAPLHKIAFDGKIEDRIGVALARVSVAKLAARWAAVDRQIKGVHAALIDEAGRYVIPFAADGAAKAPAALMEAVKTNAAGDIELAVEGMGDSVVVYASLPYGDRQLTLASGETQADALASVYAMRDSMALVSVGVMVVAVVAALLFGMGVARPMRRITDAMGKLAADDLDIDLSDAERKDEIGAMSRAVAVFRDNAARIRELDAKQEAAERQAAEARRAMMRELQTSFGSVIDAAVEGDFSRRIDARFDDQELQSLSVGVNRLVESVDAGVAETNRVMARIAQGDLSDRMHGEFHGAFGRLKTDLNQTIARLQQIVGETQRIAAEIEGATAGVANDARNLADRTESQAASLEETAATMEEMSATVGANAENAEKANGMSGEARNRARRGRDIVGQAVSAMTEIESSSSKISDIISVIDGIAFQTNLLALNAAVEAARAGEAGKGFAVVASEVRTLSQRSSEAAQDIKELILESSDKVSGGAKLVNTAGESLDEILQSVQDVAATIEEISSASREQSAGVAEVTSAISSMDTITQQNTQMVEQTAASAQGMADLAKRLGELLSFFKQSQEAARKAA